MLRGKGKPEPERSELVPKIASSDTVQVLLSPGSFTSSLLRVRVKALDPPRPGIWMLVLCMV
jgi:hypothetical protein